MPFFLMRSPSAFSSSSDIIGKRSGSRMHLDVITPGHSRASSGYFDSAARRIILFGEVMVGLTFCFRS
jgi:hypothetical protein